ncbi:MarR family transcriptional regulator [Clostridium beijerinckii]|uniref:MarR family transcriptional regulator n=1 Tax=Clostridium beijerinckii TaxID=1520 RepID=A0A0B5Q7X4_CLOBE|nr:MarR family transcriptional regulator [Clostridium beijerinckii]AJG98254.1 MarR family transcriptional regulator [Clostridium beijerinckii]
MKFREDWPNNYEELVERQADEIIKIFKSIKKNIGSKFEESAKKCGFTATQLSAIFHLHTTPLITLQALSEHMGLTKSTVSGIIDRLEKQGVVVREIPNDNRRIVRLSISEEFEKNNDIQKIKMEFRTNFISKLIKNVDSKEVSKIIYGLKQFNIILNEKEESA